MESSSSYISLRQAVQDILNDPYCDLQLVRTKQIRQKLDLSHYGLDASIPEHKKAIDDLIVQTYNEITPPPTLYGLPLPEITGVGAAHDPSVEPPASPTQIKGDNIRDGQPAAASARIRMVDPEREPGQLRPQVVWQTFGEHSP